LPSKKDVPDGNMMEKERGRQGIEGRNAGEK
jgi:hypothetical protein